MYHENIQKKKGEEKRKIHFLPHKRSEIGIGWQSIAWLEGFQTGRVSGTRPRYHRIAHRTGLPRNKRLRRCGNVGASKQVLFGPGKRPEARGEGRGGCPPLLIYSILAEYGRRARRERGKKRAGATTGMNVFNSSGALVDAVSFDRQLLGVQWGAEAAAQCRARHNRVKLYMHVRVRLGTPSIHRVNGIGIRNSNTIYARV